MQTEIQLGTIVTDEVSGFTGLVTTVGEHITGCERIGVHPVGDEPTDRRGDDEFFFEEQLKDADVDDNQFKSYGEEAQTDVDFDLGEKVKDTITGVEGYVTVINYHLWNCPAVAMQPESTTSGEVPDIHWADAPRVTRVDDGIAGEFDDVQQSTETATTGPVSDTPNRSLSSNQSLSQ